MEGTLALWGVVVAGGAVGVDAVRVGGVFAAGVPAVGARDVGVGWGVGEFVSGTIGPAGAVLVVVGSAPCVRVVLPGSDSARARMLPAIARPPTMPATTAVVRRSRPRFMPPPSPVRSRTRPALRLCGAVAVGPAPRSSGSTRRRRRRRVHPRPRT